MSSISGVSHVYFQQTLNDIDILNGVASIHLDRLEDIRYTNNDLIPVTQKRQKSKSNLTAKEAIDQTAKHFGFSQPGSSRQVKSVGRNNERLIFQNSTLSRDDIEVRPVYVSNEENLSLTWEVTIHLDERHEKWATYIDAERGEVIRQNALFLECNFGTAEFCESHTAASHSPKILVNEMQPAVANSYNVFPIPLEAPNEGGRSVEVEPWLAAPAASPFGWHDTDGIAGPEFTITRGNNVYAIEDLDGLNGTIGSSPDGGGTLMFDFNVDTAASPSTYTDGAIVNLFYMNNIMHDVTYLYGFDVAAGNFQDNKYDITDGIGGDALQAEAQDGSDTNNARFFLSNDGGFSWMEMYEWAPAIGSANLEITAPGSVIGNYAAVKAAGFGPGTGSISGEVVLADPVDACTPVADLSGKIALIDRGSCNFTVKVKEAQNAGAIGAIVCNNIPGASPFGMGGTDASITIPSAMISYEDCQTIRVESGNNLTANLDIFANTDSDLDNGIIAHEYGHGISTRLTGGAGTLCLGGNEQMGEGWSDYFSLLLQMKPGDEAYDRNGIGTYVLGDVPTGDGIRPFPYSADLNVNPMTYNDIANVSIPHGVGSVWATMLWDMTWNLIEKHGFEPDVYATTGGNGISMQLVMEGMKLQGCFPGFVDGRDAILQADTILFGGENACEIWRAFAKRGLGVGADQGDVGSVLDGTESFDIPTSCPDQFLQPCTENSLTYLGVTIPDSTDEYVNNTIDIEDSDILGGTYVILRAGQGINIEPQFEIARTAEASLEAVPCDDSALSIISDPPWKKARIENWYKGQKE